MNIQHSFPSRWLKAGDLLASGGKAAYEIRAVSMERVGEDEKPVVWFAGEPRGLVLNKTNGSRLAELFGEETDGWGGKTVGLEAVRVDFRGKIVDAIRVSLDLPTQRVQPQAPPKQAPAPEPEPSEPAATTPEQIMRGYKEVLNGCKSIAELNDTGRQIATDQRVSAEQKALLKEVFATKKEALKDIPEEDIPF